MDTTISTSAAVDADVTGPCCRKLLMVAVDGDVDKLLKKFGSLKCCLVTGKAITDTLIAKKFAFSIHVSSDPDFNGKPIVAKFRTSGKKFAVILGPLVADDSHSYCVCFNEKCYLKQLQLPQSMSCNDKDNNYNMSCHEMEKDRVLSHVVVAVSRLMMLPLELKVRILELLSGVELAKMGCVSVELRDLIGNDDLWKKKFVEEKMNLEEIEDDNESKDLWKNKFAKALKHRRNWKKIKTPVWFQLPNGARFHPNEYLYFLLENL